jgi:hypothetical protein
MHPSQRPRRFDSLLGYAMAFTAAAFSVLTTYLSFKL